MTTRSSAAPAWSSTAPSPAWPPTARPAYWPMSCHSRPPGVSAPSEPVSPAFAIASASSCTPPPRRSSRPAVGPGSTVSAWSRRTPSAPTASWPATWRRPASRWSAPAACVPRDRDSPVPSPRRHSGRRPMTCSARPPPAAMLSSWAPGVRFGRRSSCSPPRPGCLCCMAPRPAPRCWSTSSPANRTLCTRSARDEDRRMTTTDHDLDTPAWTAVVPAADQEAMRAAGYGATQGLGDRPALLIIDVNYGFTGDAPDDLMTAIAKKRTACGATAWQAAEAIAELLAGARARGIPVIYSTGQRAGSRAQLGRWAGKNSRTQEATELANDPLAIHAAIEPLPHEPVIAKAKPSIFFGTDLVSRLVELDVDSLLIVGGTTSGCVRASVVDAFSYNFRTAVVADGTFDRSDISHRVTLFDLSGKYADVWTLAQALKYLDELPEHSA